MFLKKSLDRFPELFQISYKYVGEMSFEFAFVKR